MRTEHPPMPARAAQPLAKRCPEPRHSSQGNALSPTHGLHAASFAHLLCLLYRFTCRLSVSQPQDTGKTGAAGALVAYASWSE